MSYSNPPPLTFSADRLAGRVILVTGASSGIGESAARLFAREGAKVVAVARRGERIEALAEELTAAGLTASGVPCDVTDEDSVAAAVRFAVDCYGRLDGAFNNAGAGGGRGPIHTLEVTAFDHIHAVNLRGVFLCLKHEIAAMLQTGGGAIVNTSSIGGLVGGPATPSTAPRSSGWRA